MSNLSPDQSGLSRKGRQPGAKNRSTVAREAAASAVLAKASAAMGIGEIATLSPLDILLLVARTCLAGGDLQGARAAAADAAPYVHARVSVAPAETTIPADLLADPVPETDEPDVPPDPVL